ncbi:MAG: cyclic nucleotide-binding domain-containing protein [Nocardioides sp.]|nr:cyclic nucleotide-binding domain-containing protein [Nocardioides sp.]
MSAQDISKIRQVPIFRGLSDAEVKKIAAVGTLITVPANWALIWEKTPADKAYIVVEGELSVRRRGEEIARLGPGDVVGETAIVQHRLRTASVVSMTPLSVIHFTREAVDMLCEKIPAFKKALDLAAEGRVGDTTTTES